ncbi:hypothetical protein FKP32DRAFT_1679688 [Trametes sanguinea]|nr:hypothetical protein FKP32DRAFT_1679688 [Trametes sanguinea]
MVHPFPIGTRVFFLEGGKTRCGTVSDTETIEGLRFVLIDIDVDGDDPTVIQRVKLP